MQHVSLDEHPLTSPFDKFVQKHADIVQNKATDIKTKKLGCMTRAKLEADLRLVRMSKARVLNLASNLIFRDG